MRKINKFRIEEFYLIQKDLAQKGNSLTATLNPEKFKDDFFSITGERIELKKVRQKTDGNFVFDHLFEIHMAKIKENRESGTKKF